MEIDIVFLFSKVPYIKNIIIKNCKKIQKMHTGAKKRADEVPQNQVIVPNLTGGVKLAKMEAQNVLNPTES